MIVAITRGLPGSGKSTEARAWQEVDPFYRVYMDRDNLREMLYGKSGLLPGPYEDMVSIAQYATLRAVLGAGQSIVLADTFLRDDRLNPVLGIADEFDAKVIYIDLRHVPVEVCIERDRKRGEQGQRSVGEDVIRFMAKRYGLDG